MVLSPFWRSISSTCLASTKTLFLSEGSEYSAIEYSLSSSEIVTIADLAYCEAAKGSLSTSKYARFATVGG